MAPGVAGAAAKPTAIVSLGDSYISGEAGRWQGNSNDPAASRDGTDRACAPSIAVCASYDKAKVYVDGSDANGCHRSDVAEILERAHRRRPQGEPRLLGRGDGATSSAPPTAARPRTALPPQADQLAAVARADRVKAVVLSIGGNDLGFAVDRAGVPDRLRDAAGALPEPPSRPT